MSKYNICLDITSNNSHAKILKLVTPNSTVLEFGPAHGVMSHYMKEQLKCKIYAVELDLEAAKDSQKFCEKLIIGNIETCEWQAEFKNIQFDFIIFADVLEHLYNPWKTLREVKSFLKPDGRILISLPNIANNAIIMNLIHDKFDYHPTGLLDNTHIRFFTKSSIDEMIDHCEYQTVSVSATFLQPQDTEFHKLYTDFNNGVVETLSNRKNAHVYQYIYEVTHKENKLCTNYSENLNEPAHFEIFYDTGSGYNQQECIQVTGAYFGVVKLPANKQIIGLRVDPSNHSGILKKAVFEVADQFGVKYDCKIIRLEGFNLSFNNSNICLGNDPKIIIECPIRNPISLIYEFCYNEIYLSSTDVQKLCFIDMLQTDLSNELSSIKSELSNTKSELSNTQSELSNTKSELSNTKSELSNTKSELSNTKSELSNTKSELSNTQSELSNTKYELLLLYNSHSWKITAPLRKLFSLIRK